MEQTIECVQINDNTLRKLGEKLHIKRLFIVCGKSFYKLSLAEAVKKCGISYTIFSGFSPNPVYEDVCVGVRKFADSACDAILAVGGGSAIDVAKCISIFCELKPDEDFLVQKYVHRKVPLLAVPTTAGTGSESTEFSVVYKNQKKISVKHESMRPDVVLLDSTLLDQLPDYQRKSTMMDALCQALESWWSVKSTKESIELSKRAIWLIIHNMYKYLDRDQLAAEKIMLAANLSGQAINITQTTAPHAMSYKMTSLYGLAHGHAVSLGFPKVWRYMTQNMDSCIDVRGKEYLFCTFSEMANCMGYTSCDKAIVGFEEMTLRLGLFPPTEYKEEHMNILVDSVNIERLKNNPVKLDDIAIKSIYSNILEK